MPDITSLVPAKTTVPTPQTLPARGVITQAPALTDPTVRVIVPSHSADYALDLRWIRQGASLPAVLADCLVVFDETGNGTVVWWAGGDTQPAGGDLVGTYPNPTIAPPPQARVFNSANISIPDSTATTLTFDSERWDNGSLHSTSSNTGRLTAPITGLYAVGACVQFATNATGYRYAELRVNGTTIIVSDRRPSTSVIETTIQVATQYQFVVSDYVEVRVGQSSGGALNVLASANYSPEFWMTRLSH